MYVFDIAMAPSGQAAKATITIKDSGGVVVPGATVTVSWSLGPSSQSGVTDATGKVILTSSAPSSQPATQCVTITNVTKTGYTYNPALNIETTDCYTIAG
jgi:hypothetical protein